MQARSVAVGIGSVMLTAGLAARGCGEGDSGRMLMSDGGPADVTTFSATAGAGGH